MIPSRPCTHIGIDISKATLDVSGPAVRLKVPNDHTGFAEILRATSHLRRRHFIFEPTGHYGRSLTEFLRGRRIRLTVVDSFRTRQFARATGRWAKTDPLDADLLAHYGATLKPSVTTARDPIFEPHIEGIRVRRLLEEHLRALIHQREPLRRRENLKAINSVRDVIEDQIKKSNSRIALYLSETPRLAELSRRLRLVVGIRQRAAETLIADLPELGHVTGKQIAALAGLAPYNHDSGVVTGTTSRHIQRGRWRPRSTLYMCALVASVHNPLLKAHYERLVAAGKPRKVALIAVARKMLVYLNRIASDHFSGTLPTQGARRTKGSYWTDAERDRMHLLRRAGVSCKIIALELGRNETSVHKQLHSERLRAAGKQQKRKLAQPTVLN